MIFFFEYSRLLKELQPKVFVAENVKGLTTGKAKGYFLNILKELTDCGYSVKCNILNSKWLGVPQGRERTIFIGVRDDLGLIPIHPSPFSYYYTIRDAFEGKDGLEGEHTKLTTEKSKKLYEWCKKNNETKVSKAHEVLYGKTSWYNYYKLDYHHVSYTITTKSSLWHPNIMRTLTIPEVKRISSFPDDFKLSGGFDKKWERLGRAVPPLMMKQIAKTIESNILNKCVG